MQAAEAVEADPLALEDVRPKLAVTVSVTVTVTTYRKVFTKRSVSLPLELNYSCTSW